MTVFAKDSMAGRTVLVTGASRGIGQAIARVFSQSGAKLIVTARDEVKLNATARELGDAVIGTLVHDLGVPGEAETLATEVLEICPTLDVLVNCAGIVTAEGPGMPRDGVDKLLEINLRSPLILSQQIGSVMAARGRGVIVNVSSIVGSRGISPTPGYAASKGGVDAMTRALAYQFGPNGVRVNAVSPGFTATDFSAGAEAVDGAVEAVVRSTALRRVGTAEDIADVVLFLASEAARFITGEVVVVDGGFSATKDLIPPELVAAAMARE